MAQLVRALSNKPDNLTSIPSTFMVKKENYVLQMSTGILCLCFNK